MKSSTCQARSLRRATLVASFLTGPHTLTAFRPTLPLPSSQTSSRSLTTLSASRADAVKASVPKRFNCPGAADSPSRGGCGCRLPATSETYNTTDPEVVRFAGTRSLSLLGSRCRPDQPSRRSVHPSETFRPAALHFRRLDAVRAGAGTSHSP